MHWIYACKTRETKLRIPCWLNFVNFKVWSQYSPFRLNQGHGDEAVMISDIWALQAEQMSFSVRSVATPYRLEDIKQCTCSTRFDSFFEICTGSCWLPRPSQSCVSRFPCPHSSAAGILRLYCTDVGSRIT